MIVYEYLEKFCSGEDIFENIVKFDILKVDLGYGLLFKCYMFNVVDVIEEYI